MSFGSFGKILDTGRMKSKKKKEKKDKGPPVHMSSWSEVSGNTSPSELMYFSKDRIQKYDFFRRVKDFSEDVRIRTSSHKFEIYIYIYST